MKGRRELGQAGHRGKEPWGWVCSSFAHPPSKEKAGGCWTRSVTDFLPLLPDSAGQRFQHEPSPPLPILMSTRSEREGSRETGSPHELIFPF